MTRLGVLAYRRPPISVMVTAGVPQLQVDGRPERRMEGKLLWTIRGGRASKCTLQKKHTGT